MPQTNGHTKPIQNAKKVGNKNNGANARKERRWLGLMTDADERFSFFFMYSPPILGKKGGRPAAALFQSKLLM